MIKKLLKILKNLKHYYFEILYVLSFSDHNYFNAKSLWLGDSHTKPLRNKN